MLKNIDGIHNRNLTVGRRTIYVAVELRIIWLIFLKHIVDSCEQYPGNNRFLMFPSLFKSEITVADFGKFLSPNRAKGTLNKQRFNVGPCPTNSGGFLLPGALIVLRRKPRPGAKMLLRWRIQTYPLRFQK